MVVAYVTRLYCESTGISAHFMIPEFQCQLVDIGIINFLRPDSEEIRIDWLSSETNQLISNN